MRELTEYTFNVTAPTPKGFENVRTYRSINIKCRSIIRKKKAMEKIVQYINVYISILLQFSLMQQQFTKRKMSTLRRTDFDAEALHTAFNITFFKED